MRKSHISDRPPLHRPLYPHLNVNKSLAANGALIVGLYLQAV